MRLADVENLEAFVRWQVQRLGFDQDEAVPEGIVLALELYRDWDPERCPRFSAYLLSGLPQKLISWHRRELRQSGRGSWSGSRNAYSYRTSVPLETHHPALTAYGPDG